MRLLLLSVSNLDFSELHLLKLSSYIVFCLFKGGVHKMAYFREVSKTEGVVIGRQALYNRTLKALCRTGRQVYTKVLPCQRASV